MRVLFTVSVTIVSLGILLLYSAQFLRPMELGSGWFSVGKGLYASNQQGQVHIAEKYHVGRWGLAFSGLMGVASPVSSVADQRAKHHRLITQGRTEYTSWYDIITKADPDKPATVQFAQTKEDLVKLLNGQGIPKPSDFVPAAQWLKGHAQGNHGPVSYRAVLIFAACTMIGVLFGLLGWGRILTAAVAFVVTLIGSVCLFFYALGDYVISNTVASIILVVILTMCVRWARVYQRRGKKQVELA